MWPHTVPVQCFVARSHAIHAVVAGRRPRLLMCARLSASPTIRGSAPIGAAPAPCAGFQGSSARFQGRVWTVAPPRPRQSEPGAPLCPPSLLRRKAPHGEGGRGSRARAGGQARPEESESETVVPAAVQARPSRAARSLTRRLTVRLGPLSGTEWAAQVRRPPLQRPWRPPLRAHRAAGR